MDEPPIISSEATEPLLSADDDDVLHVAEESGKIANVSRKKVAFQQQTHRSNLRLSSAARHVTSTTRQHLSSVNSAGLVGGGSTSAANEIIHSINRSVDDGTEGTTEKKRVGETKRRTVSLAVNHGSMTDYSHPPHHLHRPFCDVSLLQHDGEVDDGARDPYVGHSWPVDGE